MTLFKNISYKVSKKVLFLLWNQDIFFSKVAIGYHQHKIKDKSIIFAIHHWKNSWVN